MVTIDSETLFNGAAAIVATIAVLFFILNVDFGYSPVSNVSLVILFLAGIFVITQATDDSQLTLLGYGVIVTAVIGLFFDVINTFDVGNTQTVLGLLGIAAVLFGLRTQLGGDNRFTTTDQAKYAFGIIATITVVVLLVDVVTGGLAYELQPQSQVEVPESHRDEIRIGSVEVTNPTPLPERVETPNYAVCAAGNWSAYTWPADSDRHPRRVEMHISVQDGYNEYVLGYGAKRYPVHLYIEAANVTGETFPVQRTGTCPDDETGAPYIAIFRAPDRPGVQPM